MKTEENKKFIRWYWLMDARFSSGYDQYSACCDPGYCAGYAGARGYMDVCYEPEQHEQFYCDLVYSGCGLWEEAVGEE